MSKHPDEPLRLKSKIIKPKKGRPKKYKHSALYRARHAFRAEEDEITPMMGEFVGKCLKGYWLEIFNREVAIGDPARPAHWVFPALHDANDPRAVETGIQCAAYLLDRVKPPKEYSFQWYALNKQLRQEGPPATTLNAALHEVQNPNQEDLPCPQFMDYDASKMLSWQLNPRIRQIDFEYITRQFQIPKFKNYCKQFGISEEHLSPYVHAILQDIYYTSRMAWCSAYEFQKGMNFLASTTKKFIQLLNAMYWVTRSAQKRVPGMSEFLLNDDRTVNLMLQIEQKLGPYWASKDFLMNFRYAQRCFFPQSWANPNDRMSGLREACTDRPEVFRKVGKKAVIKTQGSKISIGEVKHEYPFEQGKQGITTEEEYYDKMLKEAEDANERIPSDVIIHGK